jgi:hypothetical protein
MRSLEHWILAFCEWCNGSFFGHAIRDSVWAFPVVEIFHLLALAILGGAMLVLNMRLIGIGFRTDSVSALARDLRPWIIGTLIVMLISGFLLFSTEAVKMYGNWAFQAKMSFLLLAIIFTFTIHSRVTHRDAASAAVRWATAIVSLLLWTGVGLGGRALGYVTTAAASVTP